MQKPNADRSFRAPSGAILVALPRPIMTPVPLFTSGGVVGAARRRADALLTSLDEWLRAESPSRRFAVNLDEDGQAAQYAVVTATWFTRDNRVIQRWVLCRNDRIISSPPAGAIALVHPDTRTWRTVIYTPPGVRFGDLSDHAASGLAGSDGAARAHRMCDAMGFAVAGATQSIAAVPRLPRAEVTVTE